MTAVRTRERRAMVDVDPADLREAEDPTTPGDRLLRIFGGPSRFLVRRAVVSNPALPVDFLARLLQATPTPNNVPMLVALWHNPTTPLALMAYPCAAHRRAARRLLARLSPRNHPSTSLESLVEGWNLQAFLVAERVAPDPLDVEAVKLARHMADLFGLPWTTETQAESARYHERDGSIQTPYVREGTPATRTDG